MRVLFLTHRLPYAPNRGDRIRAYYLLRELSRFAEVSLFSLVHDDDEADRATGVPFATSVRVARVIRMRAALRAVRAIATGRPMTHALLDAPGAARAIRDLVDAGPPDMVLAFCSSMARFALEPPLDDYPCLIDLVDVDSAKWASLAETASPARRWLYRREAAVLGAFEARAARHARGTFVVNERELASLARIAPEAHMAVLPNGIDVEAFAPRRPPQTSAIVIFCGVMDYRPNVDGLIWFARHVWPLVRTERPDARFQIVGASPTRSVRQLSGDPSIQVVGAVDAVQPYLWEASVSVAPLRLARGLQNKVLEAIAAGLPVVITSPVQAGLPAHVLRACLVADEARAFAAAVVQLLRLSPEERRSRAAAGNIGSFTWDKQFARLEEIVRAAIQSRSDKPARQE